MKWDEDHQSPDVEDRRGEAPYGGGGGGGGPWLGGFGRRPVHLSLGGVIVIALVLAARYYLAGDLAGAPPAAPARSSAGPRDDRAKAFVGFVLDDVQASWERAFTRRGDRYVHAKLVLFDDETQTGCGEGEAATGPFYCPRDRKVYIDLSFYEELRRRFGAPGDFAQAYVIAHEIGHHVQNLLGIEAEVERKRRTRSGSARDLSVDLELQADCLAGVWARSTEQRHLLDPGDMQQALRAAAAIGDDRLQRMAHKRVQPETWTHGSSSERTSWLERGYERGTIEACDTFAVGADGPRREGTR